MQIDDQSLLPSPAAGDIRLSIREFNACEVTLQARETHLTQLHVLSQTYGRSHQEQEQEQRVPMDEAKKCDYLHKITYFLL